MNESRIRNFLNSEWDKINREAKDNKQSQSATFMLIDLFKELAPEDRLAAERVIIEWLFSSDPAKQFDGLAMIDEFAISAAIPALSQLVVLLTVSNSQSSPYDLAKVKRILSKLKE